jgi:8-oxo-dGTP diphosphatase
VIRNGTLLLVRRALEPWRGSWCAPSGFCDEDEHPINAAEREVLEEAGVRARVTGFLGVWVSVYGYAPPEEGTEWVSVAYYIAESVDGGDGVPDGVETSEIAWFPLDRLPAAETLAPPDRFTTVLDAFRIAHAAGATTTPLLDRPAPR